MMESKSQDDISTVTVQSQSKFTHKRNKANLRSISTQTEDHGPTTSRKLPAIVPLKSAIERTRDLLEGEIRKRRLDKDETGEDETSTYRNDVEALRESLRWTETELKSAQAHVLCLGDSVNSWSAMSGRAVNMALERATLESMRRGVPVIKLNATGFLGRARQFCQRFLFLVPSSSSKDASPSVRVRRPGSMSGRRTGTIYWCKPDCVLRSNLDVADEEKSALFARSNGIDTTEIVSMSFGRDAGTYIELLSRADEDRAKALVTRCVTIVGSSRSLDIVFKDSVVAIDAFMSIQSMTPFSPSSSWRRTREQLQWECAQITIDGLRRRSLAIPTMACERDVVDFARLMPLFNFVQRGINDAKSDRESFRLELRRHRDAVHTLPLPNSNERIHRIVSEEQHRKDLIRESGLVVNNTYYEMGSPDDYDVFVLGLSKALEGVEIISPLQPGASPMTRLKRRRESGDVATILSEVLRSMSRTLTDGDAFSVLHRCFSVPGSVLITPSGPQIPISVFVSHDAIVTIQCKSCFNAVHMSKDARRKPQVWATIQTTVVENIYFDHQRRDVRRIRHLLIGL